MIIKLRVSKVTHGHFAEVHSYQFDESGDLNIRIITEKGQLDLPPEDFEALHKAILAFKAAETPVVEP